MAGRLALSRADVTFPDAPDLDAIENASVIIRGDVLRITARRTGALLGEYPGVVAVETVRQNREWMIRFGEGSIHVERSKTKDCGCG